MDSEKAQEIYLFPKPAVGGLLALCHTLLSSLRTEGPITTGFSGTMTGSYASSRDSAVWVPAFAGTTAGLYGIIPRHAVIARSEATKQSRQFRLRDSGLR